MTMPRKYFLPAGLIVAGLVLFGERQSSGQKQAKAPAAMDWPTIKQQIDLEVKQSVREAIQQMQPDLRNALKQELKMDLKQGLRQELKMELKQELKQELLMDLRNR